jgi:hypothetical protein
MGAGSEGTLERLKALRRAVGHRVDIADHRRNKVVGHEIASFFGD